MLIEQGKNNPNTNILEILYSKYYVNFNWLIIGSGNIFIDESELNSKNELKLLIQKIKKLKLQATKIKGK